MGAVTPVCLQCLLKEKQLQNAIAEIERLRALVPNG